MNKKGLYLKKPTYSPTYMYGNRRRASNEVEDKEFMDQL